MSGPTQIGRYQIVGELATGGMAEILLGKLVGPSGFERPVVIKRILPHLAKRSSFVQMFLDEARVVARIRHPNVVHVHELGKDGDELFMVMEYLDGESLQNVQRRTRKTKERLPLAIAAHVVAQVAAGLHAAHELADDTGRLLGLVHRDVSPHNVFITYDGNVKVLDFGIAKFAERATDTEAGQLKGKFPYMSPEQCKGLPLDRRSDVFSLGTVLFELATGRRLFARDTGLLAMQAVVTDRVPSLTRIDPSCPPALERVVMKALAKDASERYATAAEMRRDLVAVLRTIEFDAIPEEALAERMLHLFPDRRSEKAELLRRVSSGSAITSVPEAEVDVSIELPAAGSMRTGPTGAPLPEAALPTPPPRKRGMGLVIAAAAVILLGAGGGIAWSVTQPGSDARANGAEPPAPPVVANEPEPELPGSADPAPAPAPAPAVEAPPAEVTLVVRSTPEGATVSVDGEIRGVTPLELTVPFGDEAVEVAVSHDGYETVRESIVPNEDERIVLSLPAVPVATPAAPRPRPATMATASPFRRFN